MNDIVIEEFPGFLKKIRKILSEEERETLYRFLEDYPESGDIIPKTNGLRKLGASKNPFL